MVSLRRKSPEPAKTPGRSSSKPPKDDAADIGQVERVRLVWKATRESDPKLPLYTFGPAIGVLAVLVIVGVLISHIVAFSILGVLLAVLAATSMFGRRAQKSLHNRIEGQVGAAVSILQNTRGDWQVTPAVGFTRNQDLVHRAIGRAGVVLVGEGPSTTAIKQLMSDQKRRINRVAPDVVTHEFIVGNAEGQVPLAKLSAKVMRLPRTMRKEEVRDLEHRLKALGGTNMPIPKGPMPKNARMPRGKMP